eukprot:CAMPEP_0182561272 /NCGR_PEP_ID=MMETSP1324-20130603/3778_1 /TAXON_ID=236786 /ORGANISM="Florenciella sp., Strain RCC1587" /LENGTH=54 /DNA_ID=CAMNT_0024773837 /DNA_START=94 /DNA_END=254 /DNA_ORIENTATION=-
MSPPPLPPAEHAEMLTPSIRVKVTPCRAFRPPPSSPAEQLWMFTSFTVSNVTSS